MLCMQTNGSLHQSENTKVQELLVRPINQKINMICFTKESSTVSSLNMMLLRARHKLHDC
jgi:hypothetical protein